MAWIVRLAQPEDYDAVAGMARMNLAESCPQREWSEDRMRATFDDKTCFIFVVESNGDVCGFLLTGIYEYRAFHGHFTTQEVLFVRPDKRGTRAAALLMKKLIEWSRSVSALEIVGGNDNDVRSDQTARFLARFGFRSHGHAMKLEL